MKDTEMQVVLDKLARDNEQVLRNENKKWDKIWAENKKKTDALYNKILMRIELEESYQNSSNWFLSLLM